MSLRVTELWAKVIPEKSKLLLTGTKLELGLCKRSKVQWKTLAAIEDGASVLFGMPEKMRRIWPAELHEILPEEIKKQIKPAGKEDVAPVKKPEVEEVESDLDMDEIEDTEWS